MCHACTITMHVHLIMSLMSGHHVVPGVTSTTVSHHPINLLMIPFACCMCHPCVYVEQCAAASFMLFIMSDGSKHVGLVLALSGCEMANLLGVPF